MFNRIGMENFRVFKNYTEFDLAPITVLTGTNNSGKSSIIKLLSLLKHSFNKENGINKLDFDGGNHKLGTFDNVLNWDNDSKHIKINLDFPLNYFDEKFKVELIYTKDKEDGGLVSFKVYNTNRVLFRLIDTYPDSGLVIEPNEAYNYTFYSVDLEYLKYTMNGNKKTNKKNSLFFEYYLEIEEDGKKTNKGNIENKYYEFLSIFESLFANYFYDFDLTNITEGNYNIFTNGFELILDINGDPLLWYFNNYKLKGKGKQTEILKQIVKLYLEKNQIKKEFNVETFTLKIEDFLKNISDIKIKTKNIYLKNFDSYIFENIANSIRKMMYSINSIDHLTARRGSQERVLTNKSANEIDEIVKDFFLIHYFKEGKYSLEKSFEDFLKDSLKILNIKGELIIEREQGVLTKIYIKKKERKIPLSDLGFGYSQIIPILLKIILLSNKKEDEWYEDNPYKESDLPFDIIEKAKREQELKFKSDPNTKSIEKDIKSVLKSKTPREITDFSFSMLFESSLIDLVEKETKYPVLIVEEPEANLHPNLQSKLADIFYLAYKTLNVHFIIESHSEYMIRKLQYLIASDESDLKTEDVAVYYLNDPENLTIGQDQIYKLKIREDGFMDNDFGQGFFDEATSLSLSLLNLKSFN